MEFRSARSDRDTFQPVESPGNHLNFTICSRCRCQGVFFLSLTTMFKNVSDIFVGTKKNIQWGTSAFRGLPVPNGKLSTRTFEMTSRKS